MRFYWGKSFQYCFYPLENSGCDYHYLADQTPTFRVYDCLPSRADQVAGTVTAPAMIVASGNSWTETSDAKGVCFVIPAISDPDPTNQEAREKKYYVVIQVALEAGQQVQTVMREITLERLYGWNSIPDVRISDLLKVVPTLSNYCKCLNELDSYIDSAICEVRSELNGCDFTSASIWDPAVLKPVVTLRAISEFYYFYSRDKQDNYWAQAERFAQKAKDRLKSLIIELDINKDGVPDQRRGTLIGSLKFRR